MSLSNFYADRKAFNDMLQTGQDNALSRQAGGMIADGNRAGAANALNRGGRLEAARTIQSDTDAQHKQEAEFAGNLATGIAKRLKAGADPEQAWQEGQQYAQAQGMADHVPALRQQWDTMGPQAFTQWLGSAATKALQPYTLSPGSKRFDENNQEVAAVPFAPQYRTVGEGQSLVEVGGDTAPQPAPQTSGNWLSGVSQAAPDAQVTSGLRTPEHNRDVGGVSGSKHLSGQAVDLVPRPGETMAQLYARVNKIPGARAINEGDHVHVQAQAAPAPGGGARVIAQGGPKAGWVTLSPQEAQAYGPGQFQRNASTGEVKQVSGTAPKGSGRLPAAALNLQNDHLSAIQMSSAINTRLDSIAGQIDSGALNLGPVTNLGDRARNMVGQSTPQSRNFASFRANLEKLRNDSLRLNKGVQTEGDAQRAWGELMASLNDEGVVRQRLDEIEGYNRQALAFHQDAVTQLREDAGLSPIDTSRFLAKPAGGGNTGPTSGGNKGPTGGNAAIIQQARDAIRKGAPRDAVLKRLRDNGINPSGI